MSYSTCSYFYRSRVGGVWGDWESLHFWNPQIGQVPTLRGARSVMRGKFYGGVDCVQLGVGRSLNSIMATHELHLDGRFCEVGVGFSEFFDSL